MVEHWGHVPIPFSTSGSSIATVVQQLSAEHERHGGRSSALVTANRDLRIRSAENHAIDFNARCPKEWFSRQELLVDHVAGAAGRRRPHYGRLVEPAAATAQLIDPDVLFVHEGHFATAGLPTWRRKIGATALVLYVHTAPSRAYSRRELRQLLSTCDLLVFVSDALRQRVDARCGGLPAPSAVVHNGVDTAVFHPDGRPEASPSLSVLFAGEVAEHKGVHLLLAAMNRLGGAARLTVVGSRRHAVGVDLSPYEIDLRQAASQSRCAVDFRPYVVQSELADLYRGTDVVVIPSVWQEPFGMVAVEAMRCGAAVVSSDRGGLPEACGGGAILVDPEDGDALASSIDQLRDPEQLRTWQDRSIAASQDRTWSQTYSVLHEAVSSTQPTR